MAVSDNPLKRLLRDFTFEFAHWLLGDEVQNVRPLNVSLPSAQDQDISADQVFYVYIKSGPDAILHIEFQGKGSKRPMKWRLLDYMGRLAESNYPKKGELRLCSYVFYIGEGVGSTDKGEYEIKCLDGTISLAWRYGVKHLWKMTASELLALGSTPIAVNLITFILFYEKCVVNIMSKKKW